MRAWPCADHVKAIRLHTRIWLTGVGLAAGMGVDTHRRLNGRAEPTVSSVAVLAQELEGVAQFAYNVRWKRIGIEVHDIVAYFTELVEPSAKSCAIQGPAELLSHAGVLQHTLVIPMDRSS